MPTVESRLIQDMNMKSFTIHYLIPHYLINMRFLTIIQVSRLTSKQVLLMEPILVHMQLVTKIIQIIYLGMKLFMEKNLNTALQL